MKKHEKEIYFIIILLISSLVITGVVFWIRQFEALNPITYSKDEKYNYHYMLISEGENPKFWDEVYKGGKDEAKKNNAYLEAYGTNFPRDYEKLELLKMAIAANVDGIILEGDSSEETLKLINVAIEKKIPVITALNDSYGSKRQGFVGVANYEMGKSYGDELIKLIEDETKEIVVLYNQAEVSVDQNIIFGGIKEVLNQQEIIDLKISLLNLSSNSESSAEERNRSIFAKEEVPDIFVCLDESSTVETYKAAIDFNMVGKVQIIGYSDSEEVMTAIKKGIVFSSVSVDGSEIGKACINLLQEYKKYKMINDYITIDVKVIDMSTVKELENKR